MAVRYFCDRDGSHEVPEAKDFVSVFLVNSGGNVPSGVPVLLCAVCAGLVRDLIGAVVH